MRKVELFIKTYHSSSALGEFIRSRRERLQPEEAGIQRVPGRRRTPGLRREEVAYLANMSVTYYTWLEQGKELNPSQDILVNIARALQLSNSEQEYLLSLADTSSITDYVADARSDILLLQMLARQLQYPCFIIDESTDILAWNRSAELVFADFNSMPVQDRHILNLVFLNKDFRNRLVNWDEFARYTAAWARTNFERSKNNSKYIERFEQLNRDSEDFRRCWDLFEVKQKHVMDVTFRLPDEQLLEFEIHSASRIDQDPSLIWSIFVPVAGSDTDVRLTELLEGS